MNGSLIAKFKITAANTTITLTNIDATSINWGDGTVASSELTHTYTGVGEYECIMENVTSIEDSAFFSCYPLTSIIIPDSVTTIGNWAFYNCSSLTSVTIPDGVASISSSAFRCCESLTAMDVDENNSNYSSLDGVLFNKEQTTLIQYPGGKSGAYIIPDGVITIGSYAFYNCSSLTSVTIPDSVTLISSDTFNSCISLTSATIPDSVTIIRARAFFDCTSLTSVTIPDGVTSIGEAAFRYCD